MPSRLPFPCSKNEKVVFPLLLSLALARCCWFCCCWLHCCCCRLVLLVLSLALFQQLQLVLLLLQLLLQRSSFSRHVEQAIKSSDLITIPGGSSCAGGSSVRERLYSCLGCVKIRLRQSASKQLSGPSSSWRPRWRGQR